MPDSEFLHPLKENFTRLRAAVIEDVRQHVTSLRATNVEFYGYAVLPPDYATAAEPDSLAVAYNCESDIAERHQDNAVYYRYSVDEWENYVHDGFEATCAELRTLLPHYEASRKVPDGGDTRVAFITAVNQAILDALKSLRKAGTFNGVPYVVIWLSDSFDDIMDRSAKQLNSRKVYREYASEYPSDRRPWWKWW